MTARERLRGLAEAANSGLALRVETLAFRDAASPSVVLGLLGELERAEARIAELEAQRDARPDVSREDAKHFAEFLDRWHPTMEDCHGNDRVHAALRSHAKGVDRV